MLPRSAVPLGLSWILVVGSILLVERPLASQSVYEKDMRVATDEIAKSCAALIEQKKIPWQKIAKEFTDASKSTRSDAEHLWQLTRLLARLRDGHAQVRPLDKGRTIGFPPEKDVERTGPGLFLCRIGKKIYVKNAFADAAQAQIRPGSEVIAIDGVPAAKWLEGRMRELADIVSFSTDHQSFFFACHWGLADKIGTRRDFEIVDPTGKKDKRSVTYKKSSTVPNGPAYPPKDMTGSSDLGWAKLENSFGYIHVRRSPENLPDLLDAALADLGDVKGLVVDFRGNSGGGFDHDAFMGRFVPEGQTIAFGNRYKSAGKRPYGGPIVAIVDATVRSAGETAAGIIKEDGRGYLIGESPTAGMSSQKTTIDLPSGLFALWVSVSSNKARMNGGQGIEGHGIPPHEIVEYDPKDLARESDTLIRRAREILMKFPEKLVPYRPADFGWPTKAKK